MAEIPEYKFAEPTSIPDAENRRMAVVMEIRQLQAGLGSQVISGAKPAPKEKEKQYALLQEKSAESTFLKMWIHTRRIKQEEINRTAAKIRLPIQLVMRMLRVQVEALSGVVDAARGLLEAIPIEVELVCEKEADALAAALDAYEKLSREEEDV